MAAVDYEHAWVKLKRALHEHDGNSYGHNWLTSKMAEIEVGCMVPEGQEAFSSDPAPPDMDGSVAAHAAPERSFAHAE